MRPQPAAALAVVPAEAVNSWGRQPPAKSSPKRWDSRFPTLRWPPAVKRCGSTWRATPPKRLMGLAQRKQTLADILTQKSLANAIAVHAACGGSTNLLLHIPAIAHAAGLDRPTVDDWRAVNQKIARFVDVLPNGPVNHPTVQLYLAGGVPEIMWHLREAGAIHGECMTVIGQTWDEILDAWQTSPRRAALREHLIQRDGVDPDAVIIPPARAKQQGLTSTVAFPVGNLCPEGSVIKATAIDPSVIDADGVFRHTGPAKVFTSEKEAIAAIKGQGAKQVQAGDVLLLIGCGPTGTGMEETYQLTSALKHIKWGKHVTLITDARFSGVSTGACIGHVGPEALAGGPIGRVRDGDTIEVIVNRHTLDGSVNLIIAGKTAEEVAQELASRRCTLGSHPIRVCRTTHACGPPCNSMVAAHGAVVCMTSMRLSRR